MEIDKILCEIAIVRDRNSRTEQLFDLLIACCKQHTIKIQELTARIDSFNPQIDSSNEPLQFSIIHEQTTSNNTNPPYERVLFPFDSNPGIEMVTYDDSIEDQRQVNFTTNDDQTQLFINEPLGTVIEFYGVGGTLIETPTITVTETSEPQILRTRLIEQSQPS